MIRRLVIACLLVAVAACDSGSTDESVPAPVALPEPSGTYDVGTTVFWFVDEDRDDAYTEDVGDPRELMVQVWYPSNALPTDPVAYMDRRVAEVFAATQDYTTPDDFLDIADRIRTNASEDAPAAGGPFPVVFYSHGLAGSRFLYTTFIEDLASRGFVVVGIDHTYGALAVEFPDGRVESIRAGSGAPEFPAVVRIWAEDMRSVLDELGRRNASDPDGILTSTMDLERVGAAGHSTGGSAALQVHMMDERFKAAMSLDAPQVGDAADGEGLDKPGLLFFASPSEYLDTAVQDRMRSEGYVVTLSGTTHYSFTDIPTLIDAAGIDDAVAQASTRPPGTLEPGVIRAVITGYTADFFARHLRGEAAPLLDGIGGWPAADLAIVP